MKVLVRNLSLVFVLFQFMACQTDEIVNDNGNGSTTGEPTTMSGDVLQTTFGDNIDYSNLYNYATQNIPGYIDRDNTEDNEISDEVATLGRVLFYDKQLSSDNTISCASCHKQELAFGDSDELSLGVNGRTGRHSMRLVNARFGSEDNFFWDERAESLEAQTTMPIQDHIEMGFSGQNGDQNFNDLIAKLSALDYYQELFELSFGDQNITEARMQLALAQFIRSIQSFDTKYDQGLRQANNPNQDFSNFTEQENLGKRLYMQPPNFQGQNAVRVGGGIGCQGCHQAPEFSIRNNSDNNGVIDDPTGGTDLTVTRSPSLRDIFNNEGGLNGPMMHTGTFNSFEDVLLHYNDLRDKNNPELDNRLRNRGQGQFLNMTQEEIDAVVAFMKTLSGSDVYTNEKWSNPFL